MTTVAELPAGFADKVLSAQSTFRSVMDAMARPGSVQRIEAAAGVPAAMMRGTAAIALTLFDHDTPLWLDPSMSGTSEVTKWFKFHTGAPVIADSSICSFALIGDARSLPGLDRFAFGSNEYPDRSTTLILQVESLTRPRHRIARPRHRWRRCYAGSDPACGPVRAAQDQPNAVSARHRCRAGSRRYHCRDTPYHAACREGRLNMYVAVKGGERAIENAHRLLAHERRGDRDVPEVSLAQISEQLSLGVDRVMTEGSLYDRELAALAIKQARGDMIEAIFLLRAFRATLPRFGATEPLDTGNMQVRRRISSTFKDIPGGQILGPTFDYTHRLLDSQLAESFVPEPPATSDPSPATMPRVTDILGRDGLIEPSPEADADAPVGDLTREPLSFPAARDPRLQNLARADEGFLLALGYSSQRGYGRNHPFAGEIRFGEVEVEFMAEDAGFSVPLSSVALTECQMVNQFKGSATEAPCFTRGYGLAFGQSERKTMSMALVDRTLRARELGEEAVAPAQDEEFVMSHSDNVQATGFVEHLKLPHYVDFQSELGLLRKLRKEFAEVAEISSMQEAAE